MSKEDDIQKLSAHFQALGAKDPEGWARSQVEENLPQYARFVFLQQAWKSVIAEGDTLWIEKSLAYSERTPRSPGAGMGPALKRILDKGVDRNDIAEVVRVMQWKVIQCLADQIDDSGYVDYPNETMPHVNWALMELDDNGYPLHCIAGLHESVLETDPTGREMQPKGTTQQC